jgi:hypothetical protein
MSFTPDLDLCAQFASCNLLLPGDYPTQLFKLLNQIPISFAGPYKESFFTQTRNYTGRSVGNYPAVALLEKKLPSKISASQHADGSFCSL